LAAAEIAAGDDRRPDEDVERDGLEPVPVAFVAVTVALNVPNPVGVPEMRPVPVFTVTAGRKPAGAVARRRVGRDDLVGERRSWMPFAVAPLVMKGGPSVTVRTRVLLSVPRRSWRRW
jgi:hypothetical protein